jgi:4-hydroxy-tetrahydrodipicolinate synthase
MTSATDGSKPRAFVHPSRPIMFSMVVTPMDANGRLDEEGIRRHLQRMIDAGVGVYLGSGGSGDGHSLDPDELARLYEIGVDECKGKVPVYCNPPEARSAREMRRKAQLGIDAGVDLVQYYQLDAGHGRQPVLREQERYFRDLLEGTDYPVALSIHLAVGYLAPPSLVAALCQDYPQIKVVNIAFGPTMNYLVELKELISPDVKMYVGMHNILCGLIMGAWGAQITESNQVPHLCQSIIDYFIAGDLERAAQSYRHVLRMADVMGMARTVSSDGPKAALKAMGFDVGPPRPPKVAVDDATMEKLRAAFIALRINALEREAAGRVR